MRKAINTVLLIVLILFVTNLSEVHGAEEVKIISNNLTISRDTTWENTVILDAVKVTVETNATLTLEPGTIVAGRNGANINVFGKLKAIGEDDKKIRFTKEENQNQNLVKNYSIYTTEQSEIELKNFILENGGGYVDFSSSPALVIKGKARLSSGVIRRNYLTAVRIWSSDVKINNCEIYENESISLENKTGVPLDVEENWWGSENKPNNTSSHGGNWLSGSFDFDPWQKKGPIPIIILPGFGGSFSFKLLSDKAADDWKLTPIGTAAYRYFAKVLVANNYIQDKDYFWGFYDWREDCEESAHKYLETVITKAKKESGHSQVQILAHSMGGLVARSYIQGNYYRDDVDRLLTAGTPHLGASETYPIWEGGELSGGKKPLTLYLWYLQILDNNWNRVDYIRKNFPSLGQMRPIYDYLINLENNELLSYKKLKGKNKYLESLEENMDLLKRKVKLGLIVGTGEKTLEKIPVLNYSQNDGKWRDGIPGSLNPLEDTNQGDGTVTVKSATGNGNLTQEIIKVESEHRKLLESGWKAILDQFNVQAKVPLTFKTLPYFVLTAYGPVDTEISNSEGKTINKSFQNIPESKFDLLDNGENYLIYSDLPMEFNGRDKLTLKVSFTGKSQGKFKTAFWHLSERDDLKKIDAEYPIDTGIKITFEINLDNTSTGEPNISIDSIAWSNLVNITKPRNNAEYLNWQYLSPETNVWQIGGDFNKLQLDHEVDGEIALDRVDLSLLSLGKHKLKAVSQWEINGNSQREEKEVEFSVKTSLKSLITLLNRYYKENKISNWEKRSEMINLLTEAYQDSSNGKEIEAKNKINEISIILEFNKDFLENEEETKLKDSLKYLAANQKL